VFRSKRGDNRANVGRRRDDFLRRRQQVGEVPGYFLVARTR
jgi:hypothetical protein